MFIEDNVELYLQLSSKKTDTIRLSGKGFPNKKDLESLIGETSGILSILNVPFKSLKVLHFRFFTTTLRLLFNVLEKGLEPLRQ